MPASAPFLLERFQNNAARTTGPNTAPNPAHAKDTIPNTELSGFPAKNTAITAIKRTVARATWIVLFSVRLTPNIPFNRFSETAEEAARSWESAVDIVQAKIPASVMPAPMIARNPCWHKSVATWMMIVSEEEPFNSTMTPFFVRLCPTTPIKIATAIEITTHTVAIRLDIAILSSCSVAIKRRSTWGTPKYPSPQASVEIVVIVP